MKITREKACQRMHHRLQAPLTVNIEGNTYPSVDWSLGGLRVCNWDTETVSVCDTLQCHFNLPFQGFDIAFNTTIEVVRICPESHEMAARFLNLDDRQIELMKHFVEQLVRGSMVPVDDTILRIDSPVTPVSTKPDPSPREEVPVSRWPTKLILMSIFYIALGLVVFSALAGTVFNNFLSVTVTHAVTEKPVEPIISLADGRIAVAATDATRTVDSGTTLFTVSSPELNQQIKDAKVDLESEKLELEALRKKHAVVIDIHGSHLGKEARFIEIEIDKKQQDVALATQSLVNLYEQQSELIIRSPDRGRVVRVLRNEGSLVRKGDTLAMFEFERAATVAAYMTHEDARHLTINEQAQVHSRLYGTSWDARVFSIAPIDFSPNKFSPDERTLRVELRLLGVKQSLPSGTPVEINFPGIKIAGAMAWLRSSETSDQLVAMEGGTI